MAIDNSILYSGVNLNSLLAAKNVLIQHLQERIKEDFKQILPPCPLFSQLHEGV